MKTKIILFLMTMGLFVFSGCEKLIDEDTEPEEKPENKETHEPNINLSETSIDFGEVRIGKDSTQSFSISNTGDTILNTESADLQDTVFKVISPDFPQEIDPEDDIVVTIEFHPAEEKSYSDNLTITSNDPDESEAAISLKGVGIKPPPGTMKWRYAVSGSVPAIGEDGTIYIDCFESGKLYAINPDGKLKWQLNPEETDLSANKIVIGSDGTIYVLRGYDLCAINQDGTVKWKYTTEEGSWDFNKSLAVGADGTIYLGSSFSLYAVNPNGTLKWKSEPGGKLAIGSDGTLYVSSWDYGYLYAFNEENGDAKWQWTAHANASVTAPVIGIDNAIYIGELYSNLYCLYAINPDGTKKWSWHIGPYTPVVGENGMLYVQTRSWIHFFLNGVSWKSTVKRDYEAPAPPAVGKDGTAYVTSASWLYAFDPDLPNETEKWRFFPSANLEENCNDPKVVTPPVIGGDGTIYVIFEHTESASPDRVHSYLYAIRGDTPLADSPWPMYRHDPQHTGRQD